VVFVYMHIIYFDRIRPLYYSFLSPLLSSSSKETLVFIKIGHYSRTVQEGVALPFHSSVAMSKFLNFTVSQFPPRA
jgi:hypothetical protein